MAALMVRDRHRLEKRLRNRPGDIEAELVTAELRVQKRRSSVPPITYPAELPITERRHELLELIGAHQVVVVAGETGSGKSTQIPKICLELGRGVQGLIGHTQPRRLAARSVSERIAEELGSEVGAAVGFTVRFSDQVGENTLIKVMTDGILLAETRRDQMLLAYDTLIIDEAHERSLNIDFLLGYVKQLLPRRPDLKIIITSATIDTEKFSQHFGNAPIVEVSGRTYPVDTRYRSFGEEPGDTRDQTQAITDAVAELEREGPGDVLVFLSGEREIHDTADALRRLNLRDTEIMPLYARLTAAEQRRVFQAHKGRRVVLSTNVAETSLTVPGVRYVVDTGTARISRYNRRLKVQRLPIEAISQASANQRAGRCGRVAPGICIRLYSQDDFADRPEFTEPEILRTNLASVILQAASLDLGDIAEFPFVDPPDARAIKDGVALLEELGAFAPDQTNPDQRLTTIGRRLAQLPLDPRLGRMVLEAERHNCVREVMIIASALSIQDPRDRPSDNQAAADQSHARFRVEGSDFLGFVKLWEYIRQQQSDGTKGDFRRMCKAEFLHYLRIREWQDINRQLRETVAQLKINVNHEPAEADRVHLSLLAGLLSQIGMRTTSEREFIGARNAKFVIANGSTLTKKPPKWVMAAELVETNRLWARVAARIQPEWVERVGAHLCKRSITDPHWDAQRGTAVATERVSMYGLPIVPARNVDYARIDPAEARELFIHHALVQREWTTTYSFVQDNLNRIDQVRTLEDRARRRDIVLGDEQLFQFFDARVPAEVTGARHFDKWWKREQRTHPRLLNLTVAQIVRDDIGPIDLAQFPDQWLQGTRQFRLSYIFEPGNPIDGVLVHVPLAVLSQVVASGFDWFVPGHRAELVDAMLRGLPKVIRRQLTPIGEHVQAFLATADPTAGPMIEALASYVSLAVRDVTTAVHPSEFDMSRTPEHLRVTFTVDDESGIPIAVDKDLQVLVAKLAPQMRGAIAGAVAGSITEQNALQTWTVGTVPHCVEVVRDGHAVQGFPALVDNGDSVSLRVLSTQAEQQRAMRLGTRRLIALSVTPPRKAMERMVNNDARLALARMHLGAVDALVDDCITAALDQLIRVHSGPAWDEPAFVTLRDAVRSDLADAAEALVKTAALIAASAGRIASRLDTFRAAAFAASVDDINRQLRWLVNPGFVTATGAQRLGDVLRYTRAIEARLDKLTGDAARDAARTATIGRLQDDVDDLLLAGAPARRHEVMAVRWMVEELRVSVFAQSVKAAGPVSEPRIRKELARLNQPIR